MVIGDYFLFHKKSYLFCNSTVKDFDEFSLLINILQFSLGIIVLFCLYYLVRQSIWFIYTQFAFFVNFFWYYYCTCWLDKPHTISHSPVSEQEKASQFTQQESLLNILLVAHVALIKKILSFCAFSMKPYWQGQWLIGRYRASIG